MNEHADWDDGISWDSYFLGMARHVSSKSRDPSTKCGCVLVSPGNEVKSCGFNGLPRGVSQTRQNVKRDVKYRLIVHAESNAVLNAARLGLSTMGCTAFVTGPPCISCSADLIQAGIVRVVYPEDHNMAHRMVTGKWADECQVARQLLFEAKVRVEEVQGT